MSQVYHVPTKCVKYETEDDVAEIVAAINSVKEHLEEVRFSGNSYSAAAAAAIAGSLKSKQNLKRLYINDMFTGRSKEVVPRALAAFSDALVDKNELVALDVSDNALNYTGAEAIYPLISENLNIRHLNLSNNGLGVTGGKVIANALLKNAENCQNSNRKTSLESLVIGRNRLENGSIGDLAKALEAHNESIQEIRIYQNGIMGEGIATLFKCLEGATKLTVLDCQDNTFTELGCSALGNLIPFLRNLKVLDIGDCLLKAKGALNLFNQLEKHHYKDDWEGLLYLESLNLLYDEIDEDGAFALAKILPHFPALKTLQLNGNCFNPEGLGAEAIRNTLERMGLEPENVLDEWDEMDFESEEEVSEDTLKVNSNDLEKHSKKDENALIDEFMQTKIQ